MERVTHRECPVRLQQGAGRRCGSTSPHAAGRSPLTFPAGLGREGGRMGGRGVGGREGWEEEGEERWKGGIGKGRELGGCKI